VTASVSFTTEAEEHADAIDDWWRERRTKNPLLFRKELEAAVAVLEIAPEAGKEYPYRASRAFVGYFCGGLDSTFTRSTIARPTTWSSSRPGEP
jgi:hypothetical protein